MRYTPEQFKQLAKSAILGAFTGIVFAVVGIALPGALALFLVGVFNLDWDLSWFPNASLILTTGAVLGAAFAAILFIKDPYIPYVEEVQDFEEDPDDPFGSR